MSLNDARLYLILDRSVCPYDQLFEITKKAVAAGVDILQLRDKTGTASDILAFSRWVMGLTRGRIPYIVNDRIDLAQLSGASGVHLGQEDVPLRHARRMLGDNPLIGVSCQTLAQAVEAEKGGADYIGFGSVFKTKTKPERQPMDLELLRKVYETLHIPVFAIGGIDLPNCSMVKAAGADRVAVCRAILEAKDVEKAVRRFKMILQPETAAR